MGAALGAAYFLAMFLVLPKDQWAGWAGFGLSTLGLGALLYALALPGDPWIGWNRFQLSRQGVLRGITEMLRALGIFAIGLALARWIPARAYLGVVGRRAVPLFAAAGMARLIPTLQEDADRIRLSQRARGFAPRGLMAGAARFLPLVVPLFVLSVRRAREQAIAVRLAGLSRPPRLDRSSPALRLTLTVTFAAFAVVGRLALLGVPGVSLSFLVVFLAGVAYGVRVGMGVGLLSRLASDLLISGLNPVFAPMALVELLLGLLAGLLGHLFDFGQRGAAPGLMTRALLVQCGLFFTLAFSVAADTLTWAFYAALLPTVPEAASQTLWGTLVLRGILFNVPSVAFNAILFPAAVPPILRSLRANGLLVEREAGPALAPT